jgi:peptidoglycan hydrolase CwlO-like protein
MIRRSFFISFLFFTSLLLLPPPASADTIQSQIDANNTQLVTIQAQIAEYQKQLGALGSQKKTLQSAISELTLTQKQLAAQMQATQTKISSANLQIQKLSSSIGDKEETLAADQAAIAKALRRVAQNEGASLITDIISSNSLGDMWQATDEAIQFNKALQENIVQVRAVRTTLTNNRDQVSAVKADLVTLQKDLTRQKASIDASKKKQQALLAATNNQESSYQKLLAAAQAELASYSTFVTNAGGSKLLANQTVCDDWGCYYSQRDTLWGNVRLSGAKSNLASEGCLVTAMAMMFTHYGYRNVTPVSVNANPGNFSPFGGLLLFTVNVGGATATRYKIDKIDATLATGHPVIVGVHAYGGTHFVVLTSGSKGNYLMRDPYVANAKDISFTSHYTVGSIFGITKVVISG